MTIETEKVVVPNDIAEITPAPRQRGTYFKQLQAGTSCKVSATELSKYQFSMFKRFSVAVSGLVELPSADAIARHLGDLGFKGERSDLEVCPIANFLTALAGPGVEVDPEMVTMQSGNFTYSMRSSAAIRAFVKNFDNGLYPELVA